MRAPVLSPAYTHPPKPKPVSVNCNIYLERYRDIQVHFMCLFSLTFVAVKSFRFDVVTIYAHFGVERLHKDAI